MTTIYALDDRGFFMGEVPVSDPFAPMPRGVTQAPPVWGQGQVARWTGGAWEVLDSPSMADLKAALTKQATSLRWQHETGGITLPGGIQVATGTEDQNRITTVIANAQLAGVTSVDFKAASGWVTLSLEQVQGIAAAIALHVQACFSAERAHHEAISALEGLQALQTYDVHAGWPAEQEPQE